MHRNPKSADPFFPDESNAFGRTMIKTRFGQYNEMLDTVTQKVDAELSQSYQRARRHLKDSESWRLPYNELNRRRIADKSLMHKLNAVKCKVDHQVDGPKYHRFRENRAKHPNFVPAMQTQMAIDRTLQHHSKIITGQAIGTKPRVDCHATDQSMRHRIFMSTCSFSRGGCDLNAQKKAAKNRRKKRSSTMLGTHLPAPRRSSVHLPPRRAGRQPTIPIEQTPQLPQLPPTHQQKQVKHPGLPDPWGASKAADPPHGGPPRLHTIYSGLPDVGSVPPPPPPRRRGVAKTPGSTAGPTAVMLPEMKVKSSCEMFTIDVTTRSGPATPLRGAMTPIARDSTTTPRTPFDTSGGCG